jgi:hypothetical protein
MLADIKHRKSQYCCHASFQVHENRPFGAQYLAPAFCPEKRVKKPMRKNNVRLAVGEGILQHKDRGTLGSPLLQEMGMMQQALAYPFMYWVGMNTPPDTDPTTVAKFSQFYGTIHVPEVVASNAEQSHPPAG